MTATLLPTPATTTTINSRFFDQMVDLLHLGEAAGVVHAVSGFLHAVHSDCDRWPGMIAALRGHRLHRALLEDPYLAHSFTRPRGYAGDAGLIDLIYDREPPPGTSEPGARLFAVTTASLASEAVRQRAHHARALVTAAHASDARVCVLACGHFREGDALAGLDLRRFTLVDQDEQSLARARAAHGSARLEAANVFAFLRRAALAGERYDLVYTLGLTDYLDDRAMALLHRMIVRVLAPGGRAVLANFRPGLACNGWMEAVMDWQLICRDEGDLAGFAEAAGLSATTWTDPTGQIAWSELQRTG